MSLDSGKQEEMFYHSDKQGRVVCVNSDDSLTFGSTSVSKIDRYGWKVRDVGGEFVRLHKNDLHVDHSYQRGTSHAKVLTIVKNWSWIACGCIIVARRGGTYYVIDGQHRVMAAKKRVDIENLPCLVFDTSEVAQEANGFLVTQTARKPVSAVEKFNAMLVIGNEEALLVDELIKSSGRQIHAHHSSPTTIKCIARILAHAKMNPSVLKEMWPLIIDVCADDSFRETIFDGLMYLEMAARKQGESLLEKSWSERIIKIGSKPLHKGAVEAAQYAGFGGGRVWAFGICKVLNSGLRNRLVIPISIDKKN